MMGSSRTDRLEKTAPRTRRSGVSAWVAVPQRGIEPLTLCLEGTRSIRLSYWGVLSLINRPEDRAQAQPHCAARKQAQHLVGLVPYQGANFRADRADWHWPETPGR